jgi:hypothetical protein
VGIGRSIGELDLAHLDGEMKWAGVRIERRPFEIVDHASWLRPSGGAKEDPLPLS